MPAHIVLLGDSIFDNAAYTGGEPDVITHLGRLLGSAGRASLLAVDGSVADELGEQCGNVPADCSHLVVSVGGNDALGTLELLDEPVRSAGDAFSRLGTQVTRFEIAYRQAIIHAAAVGAPLTVCTIYNGNFAPPLAAVTRVALAPFNDVILRVAFERGLSVIDLRLICTEAADYANPIEPSGQGGAKIARAIAQSCGALPGATRASVVRAG
jgi:GDSL-like Lipase/Acylhydrolase family